MKKIFNLLAYIVLSFPVYASWSSDAFQKLDEVVHASQEIWEIPGVAIGCIFEDGTTWTKGYGTLERQGTQGIDGRSLFQVASLSKAFTAYILNTELQDKGLNLDVKVKDILPFFKLHDDYATQYCTFKDLLTHRSGLPGIPEDSWMLWWHTNRSSGELISRVSAIPLSSPFRSKFAYNNIGYLICGEASSALAGKSWKETFKSRILSPLGMERTTCDHSVLFSDQNVAKPHLSTKVQVAPISPFDWIGLLPAGGVITCVDDLLLWLKFVMCDKSARENLNPQTLLDPKGLFKDDELSYADLFSYGNRLTGYSLGWMTYTLDDALWFYHTGITDGQQSMILLCPEKKFGAVVLTNASIHPACPVIMNTIIDLYRGRSETSWMLFASKCQEKHSELQREKRERLLIERDSSKSMTCSHSSYPGIYKHPAYGKVLIYPQTSSGTMKAKWMTGDEGYLEHWDGDQFLFSLPFTSPEVPWIVTYIKENQEIVGLQIPPLGTFVKK